MKKLFIILILFSSLLLFACESGSDNKNMEDKEQKTAKIWQIEEAKPFGFTLDNTLAQQYEVNEIPVDLPEKHNLGSIASFDNYFYYSQDKEIPMAQMMERCDIVSYDLNTKETKIVYSIDTEGFWLNELTAAENELFWVIERNEEINIEKFDLNTQELTTIKNLSLHSPPSLNTDGNYLSWYEYHEGEGSLFVYDIKSENTNLISDTISTQSPYTGANINDGIITYITDNTDYQTVHVYDLKANKTMAEINLSPQFKACHSQANRDFVIWSKGDYEDDNYPIYAYALSDKTITCVNESKEDSSVFAFCLTDDSLFIHDSINRQILCRNLITAQESILLSNQDEDFNYYLLQTTPQGNIIAQGQKGTEQYTLVHISAAAKE